MTKYIFYLLLFFFVSRYSYSQIDLVSIRGDQYKNIYILTFSRQFLEFKKDSSDTRSFLIEPENIYSLKYNFQYVIDDKKKALVDSVNWYYLNLNNLKSNSNDTSNYGILILKKHELYYSLLDSTAKANFDLGNIDAQKYFLDKSSMALTALEGAIFSSAVSALTSAIASHKVPSEVHLITDDNNKFKDLNYALGYKTAALKLKRREIWIGFGLGFLGNVALAGILLLYN